METNSLDAILDGGDSQAMPAPAPKMEPVEQSRELVPQTGEKEQPPAPPAEATDDAPPPGKWVPRSAVEDERKKRQELERSKSELERKIAEYERQFQQPKQPPMPAPDWIADPERAAHQFKLEQEEALFQTRLQLGFEVLGERYPDLDEVTDFFGRIAKHDERLADQVRRHPNPVKFAYEMGRKIKMMQEIGENPDAYRQRLEAEILAKHGIVKDGGQLEADDVPAKPAPAQKSLPAPVPKSLARDVSQQPRAPDGKWQGPRSLDDILG